MINKLNVLENAVGTNFNNFKSELESVGYKVSGESKHATVIGVAYMESDIGYIKINYKVKDGKKGVIIGAEDLSNIYKM